MIHLIQLPTLHGIGRRTPQGLLADDMDSTDLDSGWVNPNLIDPTTGDISQNVAYTGDDTTPASSTGAASSDSGGLMSFFGSDAASNLFNAAATYASGATAKPAAVLVKPTTVIKTTSALSKIPTMVWIGGAAALGLILFMGKKS